MDLHVGKFHNPMDADAIKCSNCDENGFSRDIKMKQPSEGSEPFSSFRGLPDSNAAAHVPDAFRVDDDTNIPVKSLIDDLRPTTLQSVSRANVSEPLRSGNIFRDLERTGDELENIVAKSGTDKYSSEVSGLNSAISEECSNSGFLTLPHHPDLQRNQFSTNPFQNSLNTQNLPIVSNLPMTYYSSFNQRAVATKQASSSSYQPKSKKLQSWYNKM